MVPRNVALSPRRIIACPPGAGPTPTSIVPLCPKDSRAAPHTIEGQPSLAITRGLAGGCRGRAEGDDVVRVPHDRGTADTNLTRPGPS